MDSIREKVARAIACGINAEQWETMPQSIQDIFLQNADDALATLLAELDTPSHDMIGHAVDAYCENASGHAWQAGMSAAIQAIAGHLRAKR